MGKLNVDTALIETLAELLQRTGLTEIELAEGRFAHPRGARAAAADRGGAGAGARAHRRPRAIARAPAGSRQRPRRSGTPARCARRWSARSI